MEIREIVLEYYTPGIKAEGLGRVNDLEVLDKESILFVPDRNDFMILEDIAVEGSRVTGVRTHQGNYNPNRKGYPVPMVSLDKVDTAEPVEVQIDEVFLIG